MIGGLVTATILTLLILPAIYALVFNLMHHRANWKLLRKAGLVGKLPGNSTEGS